MVAMKCLDFIKRGSLASKILSIITFVLILISTFGYLMLYSDQAKYLNDAKKIRDEQCKGDTSRDCSEGDPFFNKYHGFLSTTCAISMFTAAAWLVWFIVYNIGISDSICSIIYYISFVISLIFLVFIIAEWIFYGYVFSSHNNSMEMIRMYASQNDGLFYMLLVGTICSFILKTCDLNEDTRRARIRGI